VRGVHHADPYAGKETIHDFLRGLRSDAEQHFQQSAVNVEKRAEGIIGGQRDVEVGNYQNIFRNIIDPVIYFYLSVGGAKTCFA
jgi:hypothetical protein